MDSLKENIVKKLQDSMAKSERSGFFGQLERLRRKSFGTDKEKKQATNFEKNKNIIDKQKRNIPDERRNSTNITPVKSKPGDTVPVPIGKITKEGEKQAAVNKTEFKKNKEINDIKRENEKTQEIKKEVETNVKTNVKSPEVKKMHSIERKNRDRFGDPHIDKLKAKNKAFQSMKRGEITKQQFMKDFPKSMTAQKEKGLRDQTEWDAYEIVLEYLLSTEQVATIEEANYVMTEMDAETIQSIVSD